MDTDKGISKMLGNYEEVVQYTPGESVITQACLTLCDPLDCQAPLSMEFSRQECWRGCHSLLQDLPNPGLELGSPAPQADS